MGVQMTKSEFDLNCPNCHSGATQAARMVVAAGTSSWSGTTMSAPLGGTTGDITFGTVGGTSQTNLAAALDPGTRPSYATVIAGLVLLFAINAWFIIPAL